MIQIISPEQRVYGRVRGICTTLFGKDNVYDYLPPEGTPFPFVRIGEQFKQSNRVHKGDLNGDTQLTLHFWHDSVRQRGTLTNMMYEAEQAIREEYGARADDITNRVIEDTTTSVTLLHGILEVDIKRYK